VAGKKRILVVEDDPMVRDVVGLMLEPDFHVFKAGSVRDALATLVSGAVDVVLLDCMLPDGGFDGVATCAERGGATVVLMSGRLEHLEAMDTYRRAFLVKPFGPGELRDRLAEAMAPAEQRPEVAVRRLRQLAAVRGAARHGSARYLPPPLRSLAWHEAITAVPRFSGKTAQLVLRAHHCTQQTERLLGRQTIAPREDRRPLMPR
jgi:DNA-binding response OmpR family regulator